MIQKFVSAIQDLVPGYNIRTKEQSLLMRVLAKLLFFAKSFTNFATTIGNTVYMPADQLARQDFITIELLAHEAQHVYDKQKWGIGLYSLAYLLPQMLALNAIWTILGIWLWPFYICAAFLIFLAPIPALGRTMIERRGYLMSLYVHACLYGRSYAVASIPSFSSYFTESDYYFMWPFKESVELWFVTNLDKVIADPTTAGPLFIRVRDFLAANKGEIK